MLRIYIFIVKVFELFKMIIMMIMLMAVRCL